MVNVCVWCVWFRRVIQNVIYVMPKPCYLLAVDNSLDTLEDIVKVVFIFTVELNSTHQSEL